MTEKKILESEGALVHPMSGAGSIKFDGSDESTLYEIKDASESYTLKGSELRSLWTEAVRQSKDGVMIVTFANGYRARIEVERK